MKRRSASSDLASADRKDITTESPVSADGKDSATESPVSADPEHSTSESPEIAPGSAMEMSPEEMRRLGHRAVDLLVERWTALPEEPAWAGGRRDELEALLREDAPEEGRDADAVMDRAVKDILERAARIDHPRFFAFVPSSPAWPSVVAELLSTGFNVFQGTWLGSGGPSQAEAVVLDWFRQWLGMPEGAGGLFTSGGSAANLSAIVTAREWADNPAEPVVYLGDQGHSSLERGAKVAGIPPSNIRKIKSDQDFRMDPAALEEAVAADRSAGRTPLVVCASAGATNTGAMDPLDAIGDVCRRAGVWYHVDAAYGGFAILTDEARDAFRGIERADSVTLDPHKWLFQPFETGCLMVRDPADLERAFRIFPEYLQDTELGMEHINFADRGVQLTRSFRALKVWLSVQMLGVGAFREAIAEGIRLARRAEEHIRASESLEVLSGASLGIVCFRFRARGAGRHEAALEALNVRIQEAVIASGLAMMSSTRLHGRYALRLCILSYRTRWADVRATLDRIEALGTELERELAAAT
jgi:aromatic-L-amino-acid/L-tryptophan decarboxylase